MKTIREYTIYCTEEHTKKALNLGAPLEIGEGKGTIMCRLQNYHTYKRCTIPTAEEMIGWLEEKGVFISVWHRIVCGDNWHEFGACIDADNNDMWHNTKYNSRKEATLAAIDSALEYLSNKK